MDARVIKLIEDTREDAAKAAASSADASKDARLARFAAETAAHEVGLLKLRVGSLEARVTTIETTAATKEALGDLAEDVGRLASSPDLDDEARAAAAHAAALASRGIVELAEVRAISEEARKVAAKKTRDRRVASAKATAILVAAIAGGVASIVAALRPPPTNPTPAAFASPPVLAVDAGRP